MATSGPRRQKGPKPEVKKQFKDQDVYETIDDNKLKLMLNNSDSYKDFCQKTYKEVQPAALGASRKEKRMVDQKNKYCKFNLYLDSSIGLDKIDELPAYKTIHQAEQDEDYETDAAILRNTKKLCKNDLTSTYR